MDFFKLLAYKNTTRNVSPNNQSNKDKPTQQKTPHSDYFQSPVTSNSWMPPKPPLR